MCEFQYPFSIVPWYYCDWNHKTIVGWINSLDVQSKSEYMEEEPSKIHNLTTTLFGPTKNGTDCTAH